MFLEEKTIVRLSKEISEMIDELIKKDSERFPNKSALIRAATYKFCREELKK